MSIQLENRPLIVESLTARELDILRLMSEWLTTDEIAKELFISVNTVKSHKKSIFQKLGTKTKGETVRIAQYLGYI